jgi:hypothetical protein
MSTKNRTREKDVTGAPANGGRFAGMVRTEAAEGLLAADVQEPLLVSADPDSMNDPVVAEYVGQWRVWSSIPNLAMSHPDWERNRQRSTEAHLRHTAARAAAEPTQVAAGNRLITDSVGATKLADTAAHTGVDAAELAATIMSGLGQYVERSQISVNVKGEQVLRAIVDSGRIRSALDSGIASHERGEDYLSDRADLEHEWFGTPIDQRGDRTVYAAVTGRNVNQRESDELARLYGGIQLVLRDEVKARSTFTLGDSFDDEQVRPFALDEQNPFVGVCFHNTGEVAELDFDQETIRGEFGYVEAQVHGGVRISDIEAVRIPSWEQVSQDTVDQLEAAGVRVEFEPARY